MSGMGETLADFIKGLYIFLAVAVGLIVVLLGVIAWLVFR